MTSVRPRIIRQGDHIHAVYQHDGGEWFTWNSTWEAPSIFKRWLERRTAKGYAVNWRWCDEQHEGG